eukprot:m.184557 g.184557  ORF g.184557 m.184557 type:complete len:547 (-) comp14716_c1_seq2:28-1668(-)
MDVTDDFNIGELLVTDEPMAITSDVFSRQENPPNANAANPPMFMIDTFQLEPETDLTISLQDKGQVKLQRVPTTHTDLEIVPSSFPGPFNFSIALMDEKSEDGKTPRATSWTYSTMAKRLFVQIKHKIPFCFNVEGDIPPNAVVRVRARYTQPEARGIAVLRCPNHKQEDIAAGNIDPPPTHVVKTDAAGATYVVEQGDMHSILVPYAACHGPNGIHSVNLELLCFSSCVGGLNRRPFEIILSLELSNRILGCDSVEVRVCACPGRDRQAAERRLNGVSGKRRGRKRKKPKEEIAAMPVEDDAIHTLEVTGRVHYEILRHILNGLQSLDGSPASVDNPPALDHTGPNAQAQPQTQTRAASTTPKLQPQQSKKKVVRFKVNDAEAATANDGDTDTEEDGEEEDGPCARSGSQDAALAITDQHPFLKDLLAPGVQLWLQALGLEQYTKSFVDMGYDDLEVLAHLDAKDLDHLKITLLGHRKKLLLASKRLSSLLREAMEEKAMLQSTAMAVATPHAETASQTKQTIPLLKRRSLSVQRTTFRQAVTID